MVALELSEEEHTVLTEAIPRRSDDAPVVDGAAAASPSALPASLTPLLGREREVEEIAGLLLGRAAIRLLLFSVSHAPRTVPSLPDEGDAVPLYLRW